MGGVGGLIPPQAVVLAFKTKGLLIPLVIGEGGEFGDGYFCGLFDVFAGIILGQLFQGIVEIGDIAFEDGLDGVPAHQGVGMIQEEAQFFGGFGIGQFLQGAHNRQHQGFAPF